MRKDPEDRRGPLSEGCLLENSIGEGPEDRQCRFGDGSRKPNTPTFLVTCDPESWRGAHLTRVQRTGTILNRRELPSGKLSRRGS